MSESDKTMEKKCFDKAYSIYDKCHTAVWKKEIGQGSPDPLVRARVDVIASNLCKHIFEKELDKCIQQHKLWFW